MMKKWMMSIAAFVLLSAMTACGVSGNAGAESGEIKSSAIVSTETAHALSEAQEHVRAGYGYGSGNADEGFFSHWIEVCGTQTEELQWYMRITDRVVVFVYPNSDYWDGSEYVYNGTDGWYYTGTGGSFDEKSFCLLTDGKDYSMQMSSGKEYLLLEIREKAKWLRTFEEMIEAYESLDAAASEGQWLESAKREYDADGEMRQSVEREYDSFGNPTHITWWGPEGYSYEDYTYTYDKDGRILSVTHTSREADQRADVPGEVTRWEYDADGNPVRQTVSYIEADSPWKEVLYEYDSYGNCTCETTYSYDKLSGRDLTEYEYGRDGNVISKTVTWYEPENWDTGELEYSGYAVYKYDAEGREIKHESYSKNGELRQAEEYRYDDKGRLVYEMSGYYQDYQGKHVEDVQTRDYVYDDENSLYSVVIYWDGRLYLNGSVSLNENGDEIKRTLNVYDNEGKVYLHTEEYIYDENGNRIRADYYDGRDDEHTADEFDYVYIPGSGETADFYTWAENYLTGNH